MGPDWQGREGALLAGEGVVQQQGRGQGGVAQQKAWQFVMRAWLGDRGRGPAGPQGHTTQRPTPAPQHGVMLAMF